MFERSVMFLFYFSLFFSAIKAAGFCNLLWLKRIFVEKQTLKFEL